MRWPSATRSRSLGVYAALFVCVATLGAWQWNEHRRFAESSRQALINRGRDITSTLGIVVNSQRRFGYLVVKDRIESALNALLHPGELESIAILSATGEPIASAGPALEITPAMMRGPGVYWRQHDLTLMNLMDLGVGGPGALAGPAGPPEDPARPGTFVVTNPRMQKALRNAAANRGAANRPPAGEGADAAPPPPAGTPRFPFSRPAWMEQEEYDSIIRKQGAHSLVISLSTAELRRTIRADLWLRSLVTFLASGVAFFSAFAWRNFSRNAELRIRLVKAGEMNSHLAEMNFAAAGLAHETRNPLNLIRGFAQMIAMQPDAAPKLRAHASAIIEEADRVTVQLNEFIDYSKPREAHFGPVDVARLVADVTRTLLPDIEDKQITVAPPAAPLTISADEALFRQALFNLLLNAVQAVSPGGRIEVRAIAGPGDSAVLEIADDGPGVPETERANIFKPYVTMREKGVGLGLAIVQQIVSAHRWEIACTANSPRGALFRLSHLKLAARPA
jgi:signal transduction histidine kinase